MPLHALALVRPVSVMFFFLYRLLSSDYSQMWRDAGDDHE